MVLGFPPFPLPRRNHEKCMEIHAFSMILGFSRFPLHRRNQEQIMEIHAFQWCLASHASHSTEEIMKKTWNLSFSMILASPRFPFHRRKIKHVKNLSMHSQWFWVPALPTSSKKSWKCMEMNVFSMILGFPRFHFSEEVMQNAWNQCISNDSGLPTHPIPQKK